MIENIFHSRFVRRRMAEGHLGIILERFVLHLQSVGHAASCLQSYAQVVEHFGRWLHVSSLSVRQVDRSVINRFLSHHLPRCHCPRPSPKHKETCRAALNRFVDFLEQEKYVPEQAQVKLSERDRLLQSYGEYLREVAGVSLATRQYRQRYAREFLNSMFGYNGRLRWNKPSATKISGYVQLRVQGLAASSARVLTVSLRAFLRYLHLSGQCDGSLTLAVPRPAPWPRRLLPQVLSQQQRHSFIVSFDRSTAVGKRDYAMALCFCRLGLRTHEVSELSLADVDWRRQTLRLRQTKQRRERLLPIPSDVLRALIAYLRNGRPQTKSLALFVRHRAPFGKGLQPHHARGAMRRAFAKCGIEGSRVHILRHTLATRLHQRGLALKAIADLLGHQSLDTTANYARVNLGELRQAALPWPENWK